MHNETDNKLDECHVEFTALPTNINAMAKSNKGLMNFSLCYSHLSRFAYFKIFINKHFI